MRISDWSSDVCSSDLRRQGAAERHDLDALLQQVGLGCRPRGSMGILEALGIELALQLPGDAPAVAGAAARPIRAGIAGPSLDDEIIVFQTMHQIGRASCREIVGQYV